MAATSTTPILPLSLVLKPKHKTIINACNFLALPSSTLSSKRPCPNLTNLDSSIAIRSTARWRLSAFPENLVLLEADPVENSQLVDSTGDDGVSTIISALLLVAFIGLSILTIGVIYIAVTDFLQKREREKFEKEEATKKQKKKGKVRTRARAGPRGFGQKIEEDDNE